MAQLLPPESTIDIRARMGAPDEASLARADGATFVPPDDDIERALARLPYAALWAALYRNAKRSSKSPVLVTRLPNARHTLAVVGFARSPVDFLIEL